VTTASANGIDWAALYRRLQQARTALEKKLQPDEWEKRKILRERARVLSAGATDEKASQPKLEVLEFIVGAQHYGFETSHIREIYPLTDLTPLPCTPAFVLGLVNVRGTILSIVDIKKFLRLPEKGLSDLSKAIIVRYGSIEIGIGADKILDFRVVPIEELHPMPPTLSEVAKEFLKGITNDLLVVLDVPGILKDGRLLVDEKVQWTSGKVPIEEKPA
jgi:purine-binding chemotaxis protein CheW